MRLKPQNVFHRFVTLTQTCGLQGLGRTTYINDHSSGAQTNPPPNQLRYFRSPICTTPKEKKEQQKSKITKKNLHGVLYFSGQAFQRLILFYPNLRLFQYLSVPFPVQSIVWKRVPHWRERLGFHPVGLPFHLVTSLKLWLPAHENTPLWFKDQLICLLFAAIVKKGGWNSSPERSGLRWVALLILCQQRYNNSKEIWITKWYFKNQADRCWCPTFDTIVVGCNHREETGWRVPRSLCAIFASSWDSIII